jgi:hypothetical protein
MKNSDQIPRFPLIINGERCEPSSGEYMDVVNPASSEVIAQAAMADRAGKMCFILPILDQLFDNVLYSKIFYGACSRNFNIHKIIIDLSLLNGFLCNIRLYIFSPINTKKEI